MRTHRLEFLPTSDTIRLRTWPIYHSYTNSVADICAIWIAFGMMAVRMCVARMCDVWVCVSRMCEDAVTPDSRAAARIDSAHTLWRVSPHLRPISSSATHRTPKHQQPDHHWTPLTYGRMGVASARIPKQATTNQRARALARINIYMATVGHRRPAVERMVFCCCRVEYKPAWLVRLREPELASKSNLSSGWNTDTYAHERTQHAAPSAAVFNNISPHNCVFLWTEITLHIEWH